MIKDIHPPGAECFSLSYAKTFLRVDTDTEDDLITDFITLARQHIETRLNATLVSRRRLYVTDRLSDSGLLINHSPVTAIHNVTAYDQTGAATELLPTSYSVNLYAIPAHFALQAPLRWATMGNCVSRVAIELQAGYGSDPEDIPMPLRQACLLMLGYVYEHRNPDTAPPWPPMIDALIEPYKSLTL